MLPTSNIGLNFDAKLRDTEWIRERYPHFCGLEHAARSEPRDYAACIRDLDEQLRIASEWNDDPPNSIPEIKVNFWLIKGIVEDLQGFCPPPSGHLPGRGQGLWLNLHRAFDKDDPWLFFEALYPFTDWFFGWAGGQTNDDHQALAPAAPSGTDHLALAPAAPSGTDLQAPAMASKKKRKARSRKKSDLINFIAMLLQHHHDQHNQKPLEGKEMEEQLEWPQWKVSKVINRIFTNSGAYEYKAACRNGNIIFCLARYLPKNEDGSINFDALPDPG